MAPMPAPNIPSAPPIPGVSQPDQAPDRLGDLARMVGGMRGNDSVTAMQHMQTALNELRQAAASDPKIAELVQAMLAPLMQGMPVAGAPGGGIQGPMPPGIGMPPMAGPPGMAG